MSLQSESMGSSQGKTAVPDFDKIWKRQLEVIGQDRISYDPDFAWSRLSVKQTATKLEPMSASTPKPEGHTRFVCISDTHNKTNGLLVPDGDILLHAGDFSNVGLPRDIVKFNDFLGQLPHPHKIVIAGNHELTFDAESYHSGNASRFHRGEVHDCEVVKNTLTNCTYLEDSEATVMGFKIYGSPWQPEFYDWAFNLPRGEKIREKWAMIPDDVDILITHGPPIGHGDECRGANRAGCVDLLHTIQTRVKPKYHVFGHIHEGYGMTTDGQTIFVNSSTCNENYKPDQKPIVFDLPNPTEKE